MPVEIREIVVKAQIDGSTSKKPTGISDQNLDEMKEEIIEECIERINQGFKIQQER